MSVALEIFSNDLLWEEVLLKTTQNVLEKYMQVLLLILSNQLNNCRDLGEIEPSDIIFIFSHRFKKRINVPLSLFCLIKVFERPQEKFRPQFIDPVLE